MDRKITVRTDMGRSDSLKESVQLFFTLTPIDSNPSMKSYCPSGHGPVTFQVGVDAVAEFDWGSGFRFCSYDFTGPDQKDAEVLSPSPIVLPGQTILMNTPRVHNKAVWEIIRARNSRPTLKQWPAIAMNNTGKPQLVGLCLHCLDTRKTPAGVFYDPLEDSECLIAPSDWALQAYILSPSETVGSILRPENLTRPLFPIPLSRNALPASSTWRLIQDRNGDIKLADTSRAEFKNHSLDTLAKSIHDMHSRLSLVFKTLDSTQQRLATFEKSLSDNQAQPTTTRNDLASARTELSVLKQVIPPPESKPSEFEASFAQVESRVTLMETSIKAAHEEIASGKQGLGEVFMQLSEMKKASSATRGALSVIQESCVATQHRVSALDEKLPALEEKLSGLGPIFANNDTPISAIGTSLIAQEDQLSDLTDRPVPQLEANSKQLEEAHPPNKLSITKMSIDLACDHLSSSDRRMLAIETRGDNLVEPSLAMDPTAVTRGLGDRAAPSVTEAKADELERSMVETKKDVVFMRKLLRTRFPALESKADALEASVIQVQEGLSGVRSSVASSAGQLASLDMRVIAVEDSLRGIRAGPRDPMPTTRSDSPLLFPSQRLESRASTPSPSREAAFFSREDSDSHFGG